MGNGKEKTVEAAKVAKALVEMMQSLTGVMDYEVDLLARQDYAGLNGLRKEKARLVRDYQLGINRLSENPTMLKAADPELRKMLRSEGEKLDTAALRNANELQAAIHATKSLVQTVMDSARSQLKQNDTYQDLRNKHVMTGSYSPISKPVAIDQNA